jgi:hypothetical protein
MARGAAAVGACGVYNGAAERAIVAEIVEAA